MDLTYFQQLFDRLAKNGTLTLLANLLFDIVTLGWLAFAGLVLIETLLPTFVIARLSLVKFALALIVLTTLLARLRTKLTVMEETVSAKKSSTLLIWTALGFCFGTIAIAHYRFPWWSIPIALGLYALGFWLFLRTTPARI